MPTITNAVASAREFITPSPATDRGATSRFGVGSLSSVFCVRFLIIASGLLCAILCVSPAQAQVQVVSCDNASMPANSSPFDCNGMAGLDTSSVSTQSCGDLSNAGNLVSAIISAFALNVEEGWAHIDSTQRFTGGLPNPFDNITWSVRFDVTGKPPGQYSFHTDFSFTTIFTWSKGASCAVKTSGGGPDILTLTSSASVQFVDPAGPVPNLMSGNVILATGLDSKTNLTKGTAVLGTAADGVTELLIRISTNSPSEQFQLTLLNDQNSTNTVPNEDGALGRPGDSMFSANQLTVTAGSAAPGQLAYAFAVYRAPTDFTRPSGSGFKQGACGGSLLYDDASNCRSVSIRVKDLITNTSVTYPVYILRPPVMLVHGLWSTWKAWKNFSPLVMGESSVDGRFYVGRADYSGPVIPAITSVVPALDKSTRISKIASNSLGFVYNAPKVLDEANVFLREFRTGKNPVGIPVAAAQMDVIGHSMGGLIARKLASESLYFDASNFGQGLIHKLITIDSPHLGSPLAGKLADLNNNPCFRWHLEFANSYSVQSVTLSDATSPVGALGDLNGDGVNINSLNANLKILATTSTHPLPAGLLAGSYSAWTSLDDTSGFPGQIKKDCKAANEPLAKSYSSDPNTGWKTNFVTPGGNDNDGIVGVQSQLNGAATSSLLFPGLVHSPALIGNYLGLGFVAPSVIDSFTANPPNPIAGQVIDLLNSPVYAPPFSTTQINP